MPICASTGLIYLSPQQTERVQALVELTIHLLSLLLRLNAYVYSYYYYDDDDDDYHSRSEAVSVVC